MGPHYSAVDAISYGLRKFGDNAGAFLVMGLLWLVAYFGVSFIFGMAGGGLEIWSNPINPENPTTEASLGSALLQLTGSFLSSLGGWLVPWGQAILAGLLVGIATFLGLFALCVGSFVVMFFLYYTNAAVVDGSSAVDAVKASFVFVKDNVTDNLVLLLLGIVGYVLVICTCYLGGIVVLPVLSIAAAYTWRVLQGRPVAP